MKLRNKRHWIALFAAIFLSSKVAAAVQVCVHDMARVGSIVESEIYASANSKADHAPAPGAEECCAAEVQARAVAPADCCAEAVRVRRGGGPLCCAGIPPLETAPARVGGLRAEQGRPPLRGTGTASVQQSAGATARACTSAAQHSSAPGASA